MIEVIGKGSIARILKDSVSPQGHRLTTMEIEVSRIVWCEFLTHGMLCRNAHSSRAIPFDKMVEQLNGKPVRFGQANKGMQDKGQDYHELIEIVSGDRILNVTAEEYWEMAKQSAIDFSYGFYSSGYHKQVYNRLTEAFQVIKAVVTATEWDNYYWLRDDVAADPTLHDLASTMRNAHEQSVPELLLPGEWHLPYVTTTREDNEYMRQEFWLDNEDGVCLSLEDAIKVSSARTGAVSFRAVDYGLEQSLRVYGKLVGDDRKHASAMQHQATPQKPVKEVLRGPDAGMVNIPYFPGTWEPGISHADREGNLWSAQYKGFIMNRKLIPGECYNGPVDNA